METEKEKKNKRIGMFTSIGVHALLVILFIFIVAWREQIPPPEDFGMSINYGTTETGSGDVQPEINEESQPVEEVQEEAVEEVVEEVSEPVESDPIPDPVQEEVVEAVQEEGPIKAEEPKEEVVEKKEEEKPKEETKPVEKPVEEKKEEVKEAVPERKVESAFKPNSEKNNDETNQGNSEGTTGDQGKEEGQLDSRSQYGGPGAGGGGFDVSLTGWGTNFRLPDDRPTAEGVLKFRIYVDERGNVVRIQFLTRIGNSEAEKFYRDIIEREMKFYRTASGDIPPQSEGIITLNLKVK